MNLSRVLRFGAIIAICALAVDGGAQAAMRTLSSGVNLANLDRTCKPCADFYQFADGGWLKSHTIPAAYSRFGTFNELSDRNRNVIHSILDSLAKTKAAPGSNDQKLADFYGSCMNTAAIEAGGIKPLDADFKAIDGLTSVQGLAPLVARLQLDGVTAFFRFNAGADDKDSRMNIAQVDQSGLGLPDRDYYTKADAKSQTLRDEYTAHVAKMFTLLGESADRASADAATVMAMETTLAQNSMTRVARRDPEAVYHKMDEAKLTSLAPNFNWAAFFAASHVKPGAINVASTDFAKAFSTQLGTWNTDQIKTYLRWHLVHAFATSLPKAFDDADFDFYSKTLNGTTAQSERWKRCASATDATLGEALGQIYVTKTFSPQAKTNALAMVQNIKETFRDDLSSLNWMSDATRKRAVGKLDAFILKIGYPDKWRDYGNLPIVKGPFVANTLASARFETLRNYAMIGKPVDRTEWGMTPPTVNAYYNPSINEIVFPAGILQPPFFDASADMAVNYGGIGAVIGHESTHGFDDEGSQFDKDGNLKNWWSAADSARFKQRTQCIVKQYNELSPLPGVNENGALVVGEATADLGGLTIAYKAFEKWQSTHPRRVLDGFTPEQRFFLGWANVWASLQRPEATKLRANTDVHAYDKFRVNATLADMPQFATAYFCKLNDAMVRPPAERCQIW